MTEVKSTPDPVRKNWWHWDPCPVHGNAYPTSCYGHSIEYDNKKVRKVEMRDKSGKVLKPGDFIVYGHALGRCAGLQYGVLLGIHQKKGYGGKPELDRNGDPVVHATVQGIDSDWADNGWEKDKIRKLKKGTLQFGTRILKVGPDQIDPRVYDFLVEIRATELPSWPKDESEYLEELKEINKRTRRGARYT
jgi:hypothetical protein